MKIIFNLKKEERKNKYDNKKTRINVNIKDNLDFIIIFNQIQ